MERPGLRLAFLSSSLSRLERKVDESEEPASPRPYHISLPPPGNSYTTFKTPPSIYLDFCVS